MNYFLTWKHCIFFILGHLKVTKKAIFFTLGNLEASRRMSTLSMDKEDFAHMHVFDIKELDPMNKLLQYV